MFVTECTYLFRRHNEHSTKLPYASVNFCRALSPVTGSVNFCLASAAEKSFSAICSGKPINESMWSTLSEMYPSTRLKRDLAEYRRFPSLVYVKMKWSVLCLLALSSSLFIQSSTENPLENSLKGLALGVTFCTPPAPWFTTCSFPFSRTYIGPVSRQLSERSQHDIPLAQFCKKQTEDR